MVLSSDTSIRNCLPHLPYAPTGRCAHGSTPSSLLPHTRRTLRGFFNKPRQGTSPHHEQSRTYGAPVLSCAPSTRTMGGRRVTPLFLSPSCASRLVPGRPHQFAIDAVVTTVFSRSRKVVCRSCRACGAPGRPPSQLPYNAATAGFSAGERAATSCGWLGVWHNDHQRLRQSNDKRAPTPPVMAGKAAQSRMR